MSASSRALRVGLLGVVCLVVGGLTAQETDETKHEFSDVAAGTQLIAPLEEGLDVPVSTSMRKLVVWPPQDRLDASSKPEDRSEQYPPVYREGFDATTAKPIKPGAAPARTVMYHVRGWIETVLKPEWIPPDLMSRILPMQEKDPSESSMLCRYQVDDNTIQIVQNVWAMWVVIRPGKTVLEAAASPQELLHSVLEMLFQHGADMANLPRRELKVPGSGPKIWVPDYTVHQPEAEANWWGWILCYTDGKSVAVLIRKHGDDMARTPAPDDPWF